MQRLTFFLRWGWLLGVGLLAPVDLPAGGADRYRTHQPEIRRRENHSPLLAYKVTQLRAAPSSFAPPIRRLPMGTPLRVLRSWQDSEGKYWLQVETTCSQLVELPFSIRRGWLNA